MRESCDENLEMKADVLQKGRGDKIKTALGEIAIYAAIFVLCLFLVPEFVCCKYAVEGASMENTLQEKQQVIGEKVSYLFSDPKRYDVVVVNPYDNQKENYYVKRVMGLPGETIEIRNGVLKVNGEVIDDKYIKEPMMEETDYGPVTLKKDEYFVMGDNRNRSIDSREKEIGPIPKERFVAKIIIRVWPLDKISLIK